MALNGKIVYIAGGCGTVGVGLTRSFLQHGARVAVSSRSQERLDDMKKTIDKGCQSRLILIKEDVSTEKGACNVLKELKKHGGVQHVISSMGSFWQGAPLTKQSVEDFDKHIHDRAKSHFICAKTFLPYLADIEGSTYTFNTGVLAEGSDNPELSLLVVGGACLYGISDAARAEFKTCKVAVNEVRIGLFIVPKLDKDLEETTTKAGDVTFDIIGNDVIGEFMVDVLKARPRGVIRFGSRREMEERRKSFKC